jgi:hypothetical protein
VESQHIASTRRLVDSNAEQAALEDILEASKPRAPASTAGLDYLLATLALSLGSGPRGVLRGG